jgi:LytS/YehU family sensor histidine kinase
MDPHFTFNAINSIASVIYDQDKDVAYDYFTKISKLIRATLDDADSITRTLDKEIEFVSNYLDIQKFRFSDKFDYNIKSGEYVNRSWKIPKMLIQIYAENAVKHGLIHNSKRGVLTIDLSKKNNFLVIEIVDNGIGRKKAMEIGSKSSGKGQKILQQYYSLFNQNAKSKIAHEIIDLKDADGKAAGTKVIIKVPVRT